MKRNLNISKRGMSICAFHLPIKNKYWIQMKTTKIYLVVCLTFLLTQFNAIAQYNGGNSNGATANQLSLTSCSIPPHYNAYFGGVNDGSGVDELSTTTCGTAAFQFAYMGGNADGAATEEISTTLCGIPPSFYAYFGGNNDGAGVETFEANVCPFPPSFYAYFGGDGDGFTMDKTAPICPTQPPVASFTASATSICVGQSVTFTDTSTNIPSAWTWTFTGGTPNSSIVQNPVITYNTAGNYAVTLVAANFNGTDTETITGYITVTAYPTITSTTPANRCGDGTLTLGAIASAGILSWYANPTGGTALGTGTSFTTPSLTVTTPYFVETVNGVCSSARTLVNATINTIPTIISTTPNSRCGTGSVTLGATSSVGGGIPFWYANPTGGTALASTNSFTTPSISITTTYYVEASNGTCTSTSRTPVIATVNTLPTVLTTTPGSRCDTGTVTLGATASAGTLNWFAASTGGSVLGTGTSFTTPSIAVTTPYYVEATNGTCTSVRTLVIATVNQTPSITSTTPSSVCDSGTVSLGAFTNVGILNWYTVATGGSPVGTGNSYTTPSISTTTTFYVESINGSCISTRVPVIATVNTTPTITGTIGATICGQGGGTLTATASAGTILWYSLATGGSAFASGTSIPVSGGSFTYYVEATNNGCTSSPRVPVTYTYIPNPTITSAGSASRCGAGSVTLTTSADSGTISWFTAPTGGSSIATGTSFVTPSLGSTTTYYVEAANGTCISSARSAITATISVTSPPIATANQTFCAGEIVGNIAVIPSGPSIIWYTAATGGTVVPNGTALVSGTTYYASQTINSCESTSRVAVTMTLGTCLGIKDFEANVIQLYPNPVIDLVTISSTEIMTKIEVVSMLGQLIYTDEINAIETKVDLSRYASGTYLIRVAAEDNKIKTFKVIKK
jgi:PKD repeat protein